MTNPDIRIDNTPMRPDVIPHDKLFIKSLMEFMETNMDNPELTVDDLDRSYAAKSFYILSEAKIYLRSYSYRLYPGNTDQTGGTTDRDRGVHFLTSSLYDGINDSKYFGKCFKKQYGMTLSEYKARSLKIETKAMYLYNP